MADKPPESVVLAGTRVRVGDKLAKRTATRYATGTTYTYREVTVTALTPKRVICAPYAWDLDGRPVTYNGRHPGRCMVLPMTDETRAAATAYHNERENKAVLALLVWFKNTDNDVITDRIGYGRLMEIADSLISSGELAEPETINPKPAKAQPQA